MRKAFHRPMHGKLWCGKVCSGGNRRLLLCPISIHPSIEKVQPCLQQSQNKDQCPEFLFLNVNSFIFEREGKSEKETSVSEEKHQMVASRMSPVEVEHVTQACALLRNQMGDLSLCGTTPNQLSRASQGSVHNFCVAMPAQLLWWECRNKQGEHGGGGEKEWVLLY